VCAGYAIYALDHARADDGARVNGFTLDREIGEFMLTHPDINHRAGYGRVCHQRLQFPHWEPAIKRYVNECLAGQPVRAAAISICGG